MIGSFAIEFWYWWAFAAALLAAEMMLPGVLFLFLAVGAAITGFLKLVWPGAGLEVQLLAFALGSGAAFAVLRPLLKQWTRRQPAARINDRAASLIGTVVVLQEPIVGGRGRVSLEDSSWTVRGPDMAAGFKVRVKAVNGSELHVEPAP
jgi:membrane protein implicated in regulation of membrane protease activity